MSTDDQRIFGRYSRDQCGLPPAGGPRRFGSLARAVLLLAVLLGLGWLAGMATAAYRASWLRELPYRVQRADNPLAVSQLLSRGRMYATALAGNHEARRDVALSLMTAASTAPRQSGYYGNAYRLFRTVDSTDMEPAAAFYTELSAAGLYIDLEEYPSAFRALARAEQALAMIQGDTRGQRLFLVNAQAYCLAVAPVAQGGNPERALHLAQLMISSRDELPSGGHSTGSAALLDTLASAWFATGDRNKALATQRYALALAEGDQLHTYLDHFDAFANGHD